MEALGYATEGRRQGSPTPAPAAVLAGRDSHSGPSRKGTISSARAHLAQEGPPRKTKRLGVAVNSGSHCQESGNAMRQGWFAIRASYVPKPQDRLLLLSLGGATTAKYPGKVHVGTVYCIWSGLWRLPVETALLNTLIGAEVARHAFA